MQQCSAKIYLALALAFVGLSAVVATAYGAVNVSFDPVLSSWPLFLSLTSLVGVSVILTLAAGRDAFLEHQRSIREQPGSAGGGKPEQSDALTVAQTINSLQVGFVTLDEQGTILSFNTSAEKILGYSEAKVLGRDFSLLMSSPYREEYASYLRASQVEAATLHWLSSAREVTGRRQDGSLFPMMLSLGKIKLSGNSVAYAANILDLSQEKKLQRQLDKERMNVAFAAKMASLAELAAGIAHEITNPLATIQNDAKQLGRQLREPSFNALVERRRVSKIAANADRINTVLNNLRTYARDGSLDLPKDADLQGIVETALQLADYNLQKNSVSLRVSPASSLRLSCRSVQIVQAVVNLIDNAVYVARDELEAWIQVDQRAYQQFCEIRVRNPGRKLTEHMANRIFDPFFTTKPPGIGTGLGLSVSRSMVEAEGGKLFLDLQDPYTCFVIRLPLSTGQSIGDGPKAA